MSLLLLPTATHLPGTMATPVQPSFAPVTVPGGPAVDIMFRQILEAVHKSSLEIAELRSECHELRQSNASLERQVKEGLMNNNGSRLGTPGFQTPAPGSPQLRAKSPFLTPGNISSLAVPPTFYVPSPLSDNSLTQFPFGIREIPGFWVVIPAGGAGTRLWPLSREGHPKFLLDLTLKGRSLIQATWDRLIPLSSPARTAILPDLLLSNLLCEPSAKDSMAAIGLAAAVLAARDPEAIIGSFAADHMISGDDAFLSAVAEAVEVAKKDYLKLGMSDAPNARLVSSFKEKPDARTAAAYIKTGNYRWNAGMFVTRAAFLMDLLKEYKPSCTKSLRQSVLDEVWPTLEKIAIDNAVAEPAAMDRKVAVVPATFGWDDVGDFSSLADLIPAESNQPRILGDSGLVVTEQAAGGIVVPASGRLVAMLGVDDIEVKRLVKKCREAGWKQLL
ncbi:mannose-1-phosphate guanylyltransferase [Epithele typhae]|uniref:mannose-1-phosphate guanylyltransferase n=1 Tax=Epithele typhae TaxID=378194 RepID=UPI0020088401|nr:mannose-1-phosphate guanylyltransferase [Epithele typhae]KAH9929556.1 mannose-1-phosphate guanylyltransferase [Epithele typhae]